MDTLYNAASISATMYLVDPYKIKIFLYINDQLCDKTWVSKLSLMRV